MCEIEKKVDCKVDKKKLEIDRNSLLCQFIHDMFWNFYEFVVIALLTTTENVIPRDHDTEMPQDFAQLPLGSVFHYSVAFLQWYVLLELKMCHNNNC